MLALWHLTSLHVVLSLAVAPLLHIQGHIHKPRRRIQLSLCVLSTFGFVSSGVVSLWVELNLVFSRSAESAARAMLRAGPSHTEHLSRWRHQVQLD